MLQVGAIVQFLSQIINEMTSLAYSYLDLFTSSHGGNQNIQGGCVTLMWLAALSCVISVLWMAVQYFEEILLDLKYKKEMIKRCYGLYVFVHIIVIRKRAYTLYKRHVRKHSISILVCLFPGQWASCQSSAVALSPSMSGHLTERRVSTKPWFPPSSSPSPAFLLVSVKETEQIRCQRLYFTH